MGVTHAILVDPSRLLGVWAQSLGLRHRIDPNLSGPVVVKILWLKPLHVRGNLRL